MTPRSPSGMTPPNNMGFPTYGNQQVPNPYGSQFQPQRYSNDYFRYMQSGQSFNQPVMGYGTYGQIFTPPPPRNPPPIMGGKGGGMGNRPPPPIMGGKGGGVTDMQYRGPQRPPAMGGKGGQGFRPPPERRTQQLGLNTRTDVGRPAPPGSYQEAVGPNPFAPSEPRLFVTPPQRDEVPTKIPEKSNPGYFGYRPLPFDNSGPPPENFRLDDPYAPYAPIGTGGRGLPIDNSGPPMGVMGGGEEYWGPGGIKDQHSEATRRWYESQNMPRPFSRESVVNPVRVPGNTQQENFGEKAPEYLGRTGGPGATPQGFGYGPDMYNFGNNFGAMQFQEGGQVPPDAASNMEQMISEAGPVNPQAEMSGEYDRLIQMTMQAILGQVEKPDEVIQMFIEEFGADAFRQLRDAVLKQQVPNAQTEGMIDGNGGGMDDQVMGMIGAQRPVAVSPGEYIVPADVVSGLGDGSSKSGADILDELSQSIRMARTGTTQQPRPLMETLGQ
jgi:hypothetical protein